MSEAKPSPVPVPPAAQALLQQAHQLHRENKFPEAEKIYLDLINRHMEEPAILFLLGTLYLQQGKNGLAASLLQHALRHKPQLAEAWNNLGSCYRNENLLEPAEDAYQKATTFAPNDPDCWNNYATLYINEGDPKQCLEYCARALALKPDHPNANWNKGLAHLELEQWREGWQGYEWGMASGDRLMRHYDTPEHQVPVWDGKPCDELIVYGEQGVGDETMFASILRPNVFPIVKRVIFDCHPRLFPLWRRSFPELHAIYPTRKQGEINWLRSRPSAKIALGSLGQFFRNSEEDFWKHEGYMKPDPLLVERFKRKLAALGPLPKIALAWAGGKKKTRVELRSIPLMLFESLFSLPVQFISTQYTEGAREEAKQYGLVHWQSSIDDLDELCALLAACDLVITVNQSNAHFAGAMGLNTWVLTPSRPAWRYHMSRPDMLWYPSVRQFRQGADSEWRPVIREVKRELKRWLSEVADVQGGASS